MTSPWNTIAKVEAIDLQDIMSEQLARNLQVNEEKNYGVSTFQSTTSDDSADAAALLEEQQLQSALIASALDLQDAYEGASGSSSADNEDAKSDLAIAELLQAQYDQDHDNELRLFEKHHNKNSKVSVSYRQLRTVPDAFLYDTDNGEDEPNERKHWDRFETNEKIMSGMSKKGFTYDKDGIRVMVLYSPKNRLA